MSELVNLVDPWCSTWIATLWRASWQGAIAIGIAWAIARYCTFASPRVMCWVWRLACIKLLTLLVWIQPLDIPLLPPVSAPVQAEALEGSVDSLPKQAIEETAGEAQNVDHASRATAPTILAILALLWIVGVAWHTAMAVRQWRFARQICRSAVPMDDDQIEQMYRSEAARLGIRTPPPLRDTCLADGPLLAGVLRPMVLIPDRTSCQLADSELRLVLAHELAHFKRRDLIWNWLPMTVSALFFFHPLTRLLTRCWSEFQEAACDELVIQRTSTPASDYGRLLLKLSVQPCPKPRVELTTVGVLGGYRNLERRILAMTRVGHFSRAEVLVAATIVALVAGVGIVPWRVVAQEANQSVRRPGNTAGDSATTSQAFVGSVQQLSILGRALHKYHDTYKHFPASYTTGEDGKPLLSWRVSLLPFFGEPELYNRFHLDEPWDSAHNKALIAKMPNIYQSGLAKNVAAGSTVYLAASGDSTVFPPGQAVSVREIIDGTSKTIAIVEVDDNHAVPWTKPDDWEFSPEHPALGLGGHTRDGFLALAADSSVHLIPKSTDPKLLSQLFTRNGREPVSWPEQAEAPQKASAEASAPSKQGAEQAAAEARRTDDVATTSNQLKRIAIALHKYHDSFKTFPASYSTDAEGKPTLSWRVAVLPSLAAGDKELAKQFNELHDQFHLNEPWNSEHNKTLIEKMPAEYRCPLVPNAARGSTVYLAAAGDATMFPHGQPIAARNIIDGLSNTAAVVVVDEKNAVPWTKPSDWEFDPQAPSRGLLTVASNSRFMLLFADGAIDLIRKSLEPKTLAALFTRNGGEVLERTYIVTE